MIFERTDLSVAVSLMTRVVDDDPVGVVPVLLEQRSLGRLPQVTAALAVLSARTFTYYASLLGLDQYEAQALCGLRIAKDEASGEGGPPGTLSGAFALTVAAADEATLGLLVADVSPMTVMLLTELTRSFLMHVERFDLSPMHQTLDLVALLV